jgi:cytochrome c
MTDRTSRRGRPPHRSSAIAGCALLLLLAPAAACAADAEAGRLSFQKCASCHVVNSETNGFGPHLKGVIGRKAGSVAGYSYSDAMRDAGEAGLVWDEQALSDFLSSPKGKVPGNKMRFFGFWFQSGIDDMIAYLKANP